MAIPRSGFAGHHRSGWTIAITFVLTLYFLPAAVGQESQRFSDDLAKQFFAKHCRECHSGDDPQGDFSLKNLNLNFSDRENRFRWTKVVEQIQSGNMPPPETQRPSAKDIDDAVDWVHRSIAKAETARIAKEGRVGLRRLNRNEYANTVRDLLGVHVDLQDLFPANTSTSGFDNNAETLNMSTYLLDKYLAAADRALDTAIANGPPQRTRTERHDIRDEKSIKPTGSVYRHTDDGVAIFAAAVNANVQVTLWRFMTFHQGKYRFRIAARAIQSEQPVTFHVKVGPMNAQAQQELLGYFEAPTGKPTVIEFEANVKSRQTIRIVADGLKARPRDVEKVGAQNYKGPGMVVQWVEIEGPLLDAWPPKSHRQLFGDLPQVRDPQRRNWQEVVSRQPMQDAEQILRDFTRRAFRRTVTDDELRPFLNRVQQKLDGGHSFEQAVRVGLKSVMVSPHFLFLREQPGKPINDFALASRLSYFLWSSMPDEELLSLAEQGKLRQGKTLKEQVDRMLSDNKSTAFTENFTSQWLALRAIDDTLPDRQLYPEYDNLLKESMLKETKLFFDEVLRNDLSVTNFVTSDFTMLNERLAKHYGISGVKGIDFRKVALGPESHRGGVLTMASVLKVSANGTTTSPILRGAWVLDRILGTPPPKPTVDIEAVEPDIRGATTIREQLSKHRDIAACAACHAKIDPPGFALENFDVIGGWRDRYRSIGEGEPAIVDGRRVRYRHGPKVDPSDVLADGRRFDGIDQFKALLLEDKDQLARSLATKLVEYATGAIVSPADHNQIEGIVARAAAKDYGLRSIVHEVVQSDLFQYK